MHSDRLAVDLSPPRFSFLAAGAGEFSMDPRDPVSAEEFLRRPEPKPQRVGRGRVPAPLGEAEGDGDDAGRSRC